jgi:hypothetical protein
VDLSSRKIHLTEPQRFTVFPKMPESGSPIGVSREETMNAAFRQRKLLFSGLTPAIAIGEPL